MIWRHGARLGDERNAAAVVAQEPVLRLEALSSPEGLAELDLRLERREQPSVVPGLLDEIARAAPHGLDREIDASPGRHHDDGKARVDLLEAPDELEPLGAGGRIPSVDEKDVEVLGLDGAEDGGRGGERVDLIAVSLEEQAKSFEHVRLIVGDEYPWHKQ
jgi:hypothetical protein